MFIHGCCLRLARRTAEEQPCAGPQLWDHHLDRTWHATLSTQNHRLVLSSLTNEYTSTLPDHIDMCGIRQSPRTPPPAASDRRRRYVRIVRG